MPSEQEILGYRYELYIPDSEAWVRRIEFKHPDTFLADEREYRNLTPLVAGDLDAE